LCSERASCRRTLATILVVPSDPSTAGTLRSPAVFDSVIIAGHDPAFLFNAYRIKQQTFLTDI